MKVLITGMNGFIGKNLVSHLRERSDVEVVGYDRSAPDQLETLVAQADFIFHLAGVNRPQDPDDFARGNRALTERLCAAIAASGRQTPLVYTSSTQAELDNPYGLSKRNAEEAVLRLGHEHGAPVHVLRLPNVFGKWAQPNYNSMVATFCYNIAHDLPIQIHDAQAEIKLVYIDDVVAHMIALMDASAPAEALSAGVQPVYRATVGQVAAQLRAFRDSRQSMITEAVGCGLTRALYSTYLSYLPPQAFTYGVARHADPRGVFVEMLKTRDAGQFSYFTAHPGITRGGHYHHSKTEKFLVIKGQAKFRFRHIESGQYHELDTNGDTPVIVETVPGWTHDITNVGSEEMIVMLWANEIFDREHPDTYALPVCP
ncbi:UDP-2-acetamido-2,6-beta-L-arabino-hexul-4-ose reductase [Pseudomonas farsensis]|uniref:NAD-dependent epimerase/dehydratase family protein n=1 Tax=Pseudomonas farsensis TaxID=2745492 RepID=A0ABU8QU43_9PSED